MVERYEVDPDSDDKISMYDPDDMGRIDNMDMDTLLMHTGMSETESSLYKSQIFFYCKDNLARVEAYIPFPFVARYILQEVLFA